MTDPSLWEKLDRSGSRPDLLRCWNGAGYTTWSWGDWRDRAARVAGALRHQGVRPGDRVACLLTNSPDAAASVLGVWMAGGCLLSLPSPSRGMDLAAYLRQLRRIVASAEPVLLACDDDLLPAFADADLGVPVAAFQALDAEPFGEPLLPSAESAAFVQYTSGSTTEPRGCVLTPRAITRQLELLARALDIDPERDTGVVWLPLSHDMGLFGCLLLTYWTGHRLVLSTPQRFLGNPGSWFEECALFQATVTAAPNFALDLATRVAAARLPPPFPMRRLVVGGERVEPATLRRAAKILGPERLPLQALLPAYGLAEAVLAVSMAVLDQGPTTVDVDPEALAAAEFVVLDEPSDEPRASVALASAGRPLPGMEIRIDAPQIGEIVVRSPCLADGYLTSTDPVNERFTPEGLRTGDLGCLHQGELFVTGRLDDLMCVAGRNLYARDLEASVSTIEGVRPGGCSIVDVDDRGGTVRLVAVVEPRADDADHTSLADEIGRAVRATAGVMIDECLFVPRGQLPKTPSGKVQRFRCRELVAEDRQAVRIKP